MRLAGRGFTKASPCRIIKQITSEEIDIITIELKPNLLSIKPLDSVEAAGAISVHLSSEPKRMCMRG